MKNALVPALIACSTFIAGCGSASHNEGHRESHGPASIAVATHAAIAVPIGAGQTSNWKAALHDLTGPRYGEYKASRTRFGLSSQITFLQSTPMGDFALIHMTGADVHQSFHAMKESPTAWDADWREMIQELHGMDLEAEAGITPRFEELFSVTAGFDESQHELFLFMVPVSAGAEDAVRERVAQAIGAKGAKYAENLKALGVGKESMFLQTTPLGQALIIRWYCIDSRRAVDQLFDGGGPLPQWLDGGMVDVCAVPPSMLRPIVQSNELIGVYPNAELEK